MSIIIFPVKRSLFRIEPECDAQGRVTKTKQKNFILVLSASSNEGLP